MVLKKLLRIPFLLSVLSVILSANSSAEGGCPNRLTDENMRWVVSQVLSKPPSAWKSKSFGDRTFDITPKGYGARLEFSDYRPFVHDTGEIGEEDHVVFGRCSYNHEGQGYGYSHGLSNPSN